MAWIFIPRVLLCCFPRRRFVYKYGRRGAVKAVRRGVGRHGGSKVERAYRDRRKLAHLGRLLVVVELCRYLFFGQAVGVRILVEKPVERSRGTLLPSIEH